jgi:hypothetical protein
MRKILVSALVLCMVVGVAGTAFAATTRTSVFSDVTDAEQAYYLDFLGSLGIFRGDTGPGGPARPNDTLTRAEFAVVVIRMLGMEGLANALSTFTPPFADAADVPPWALGAFNVLINLDIIRGDDKGLLRPNDPVLGAEALAMLTRALQNDDGATGVWPINYMIWAYTCGLLEDEPDMTSWKFVMANVPVTRAQMAMMTYNALFIGRGYDPETETYVLDPLCKDFWRAGLIVTAFDLEDAKVTLSDGIYTEEYDLADVVTLWGADSFDALMYRAVDLWKTDATALGDVVWVGTTAGDVIEGVFFEFVAEGADNVDANEDGDKDDYFVRLTDENGQLVPITAATVFVINGGATEYTYGGADDIAVAMYGGADLTMVLDDEGFATYVTVFQQEVCGYIAGTPDEDEEGNVVGWIDVQREGGADLLDDLVVTGNTLFEGVDGFGDLEDEDIVYVALLDGTGPELYSIEVVRESVTGVIDDVVISEPSGVWTVEFKDGGSLELAGAYGSEYYWGEDPQGGQDEEWTFALDRDGKGRFGERVAGALAEYPMVKITGYQERLGKDRIIGMDYAGNSFTFTIPTAYEVNFSATDIGRVVELTLADYLYAEENDGVDIGDVHDHSFFDVDGTFWGAWEIYTIDTATGELTVGRNGNYEYFTNLQALVFLFDYTDGPAKVGDYVGMAGLTVGDYIYLVEFDPFGTAEADFYLLQKFWDADEDGEVYDDAEPYFP